MGKAYDAWMRAINPPKPVQPTLDVATQQRDLGDRLRRRRGLLANLFGGMQRQNTQPSIGLKTLTGE
jgi:hypothetical protein